jgi:hypothetical protein
MMDYEISHVNLSVKTEDQKNAELAEYDPKTYGCATKTDSGDDTSDDDEALSKPVVGWHRDSYPFVCVLMLSDTKDMIGGETCLRNGKGKLVKIAGPQMGSAVVLQGRYIDHVALRALGSKERITAVTSYRPKDPLVKDDSILTTVRPVSELSEL